MSRYLQVIETTINYVALTTILKSTNEQFVERPACAEIVCNVSYPTPIVTSVSQGEKECLDWRLKLNFFLGHPGIRRATVCMLVIGVSWMFFKGGLAWGQVDQGTISGIVTDSTGAVVPSAEIILTNIDTGLVLKYKANSSGDYVFSPVKQGNYELSATASGFQTTLQKNLHLDMQERLNVPLILKPGAVSETVTVSAAPPLLQSESGSVGQVMSTRSISNTPLNQGSWVYIAQLASGVVPSGGTRGGGTGDFEANGQRAEQNNFILDGVDNNVNVVDYMNGSMYAISPPPDALSEFKIETADYSAEFGHSAGTVLNASIRSGTNEIHGHVWEYVRNTVLDARDWDALIVPPYHMNQFGATLGFPIIKNKLFYFGDIQDTRIAYSASNTFTTPTTLMRQGNFTELLNTNLTGQSKPIQLYQPNSGGGVGGTATLSCNGINNVFCSSQINPVAQRILALYPQPNANSGKTYNNLVENLSSHSDPIQWDQRLDWNASARDQAYARYSYLHIMNLNAAPLGPILDGTVNYAGQHQNYLTENFMLSETHIFTPQLTNEFRFGFNWGSFSNLQENSNANVAASLGLGGMPFGPGFPNNGGLPQVSVSNITSFGTHGNDPSIEGQNVYQVLDNVTKIFGNHSLKAGVNIQRMRVLFLQPPSPRGNYGFNGLYTSIPGQSFTGYGVADFLVDQMNSAGITNEPTLNDEQGYNSAYVEDHWRATKQLTLNLGLRYDYFQPNKEMAGHQASFVPLTTGVGTGTALYIIPLQSRSVVLPAAFTNLLQQDNITLQYTNNSRLATAQKTAFAPRLGFAYQPDPKSVFRGGFGMFYGAIEGLGSNGNLGENYPFVVHANLITPSCKANNPCTSLAAQGATLENGLSQQLSQGIQNFVSSPGLYGIDPSIRTPYTMNYNFTFQHSFSDNLAASLGYVGNVSRHLVTNISTDPADALVNPGTNAQIVSPFPQFTNSNFLSYSGESSYNSLQASLQKRYSNGLDFLVTYTWAHAMDDSQDPLGGGIGYRNTNLIPIIEEFTNSGYDVRHRFNLNGFYELPFGIERAHMNHSRLADLVAGGWSTSLTFIAQTGFPFTVSPNISTAGGGSARAIQAADPFAPGGTPNSTNPSVVCAQHTRTRTNWYNPCAFNNPLLGNTIPSGTNITDHAQVLAYLGGKSNQIYGPGFERVNMSLFKNFATWHEQYLQFRADIFNVLNHASWANPSTTGINSNGGAITGPRSFQNNTPDARFFQLSMKYVF